jgi:hypothetical protein
MVKKITKFSIVVTLLLALIGLVLMVLLVSIYTSKGASFTFRNESGFTITSATITLSNKTCSVKKLETTGEINCYFSNLSDSHYSVEVDLANGSKIQKDLGYVSGGMDFIDVITLSKDGELTLKSKVE